MVICHASKEGLVEQMPGDVFDDSCVSSEHILGIDHLVEKGVIECKNSSLSPDLLQQFH